MRNNINKIFLFFFYTLTLIINSTCQKRINFLKNRVYEFNEIPKDQGEIPLNVNEPSNSSNFIKCSDFIKNCDSCNRHQCTKCANNYIFINDNFKECVLKDSIELEFYYTNDNISYFSCRDNRYQNHKKCQELLKTKIQEKKINNPRNKEKALRIENKVHASYLKLHSANSFIRLLEQISSTQEEQISTTPEYQIFTTQLKQISTTQQNQIFTTQLNQNSNTHEEQISTTEINQEPTIKENQKTTNESNEIPKTQAKQTPLEQEEQILSTQEESISSTQKEPISSTQKEQILSTQEEHSPSTQEESILSTQEEPISSTQINKIPTTQEESISSTQEESMRSTQKEPILSTQEESISSTQEESISSTQEKPISSTQEESISSTQEESISSTQEESISSTQEESILSTKEEQSPSTQKEQILSTQEESISSTQINKIPTTQINNIPTTQINNIPTTQINKISTTVVKETETTIKTTGTVPKSTIQNPLPSTQINPTTLPQPIKTTIQETTNIERSISPKSTSIENYPSNRITNQIPITTTPTKNPSQKEKIFFFLQVQKIDNHLFIYLIINFEIEKTRRFIFEVTAYKSRNIRNLEGINKEIVFHPENNYDENSNKIVKLISDDNEDVSEDRIVINGLKDEENIVVKTLNDDSDLMDTQKVEQMIREGKINFAEIEKNGDYSIYQYQIRSSSIGCEFCLNSDNKINQKNKKIELKFIDADKINFITSKCTLSSENDKKIICNLDKEINSTYRIEPFSTYDQKDIITIAQNNNDYLPLLCHLTTERDSTDNSKKKGGLSGGAVAGIIVGIIFIIIASVVAVIVYKKIKQKQKLKNSDNQIIISKFYEYPSNASNINF